MDILEKLAHAHAAWVQPHKRLFVGPLADSAQWEIRLQVVRALPRALDSLATFARDARALMPVVLRGVESFEHSGSKALQTRARRIRRRIGEGEPTSGARA